MGINELVQNKINEVSEIDALGPMKASAKLVECSQLYSFVNAETVRLQFAFNQKRELLATQYNVTRAKIAAEATPEWKNWQEATHAKDSLEETMRAIKYYLKGAMAEGEFPQQ